MTLAMKRPLFQVLAAGLAMTASASWAQVIPVPTFGPYSASVGIDEQYAGGTFGQNNGWTVTSGTVETIGTYWQTPDANLTVDMDGISVGAIATTIDVPAAGTVSINFDLSGNPVGGQTVKELQVQLGSLTPQEFTFDITGHNTTDMGWTPETATFNVATPGPLTLSFASLDNPPSDWGPALATVTASDTPFTVPDSGSPLMLLGLALGGLMTLRWMKSRQPSPRRIQARR